MNKFSVQTVTQLSVIVDDVPGSLARVAGALANAGINLEGFCQIAEGSDKIARAHFITSQADDAKQTLSSLGTKYTEEKILSLHYSDRPGVVAEVAQALGDAGINIEDMYLSTPGTTKDTVLYVGVSKGNFAKAAEIAKNI